MITGAQPMACGNCGHGLFRMFLTDAYTKTPLLSECAKCESITIITPSTPTLLREWGPNAEGILCPMEPKS